MPSGLEVGFCRECAAWSAADADDDMRAIELMGELSDGAWECRRCAPTSAGVLDAKWPQTEPDDWCFKFVARLAIPEE